jgi:3-phytase
MSGLDACRRPSSHRLAVVTLLFAGAHFMFSAACGREPAREEPEAGVPLLRPAARVATDPVEQDGDAADDPAIWVHPTDRARSLVFGTNKLDGLEVYELSGKRVDVLACGTEPDNIDIAYSVDVGGRTLDVVLVAARGSEVGLLVWSIDPETRAIELLTPHAISVLDGGFPYGSTLYRRARDGALFAFVDDKRGVVEQYALSFLRDGPLSVTLVRAFDVGGRVEGCVADDELGLFYVAEEERAIWRYGAEPEDPCGAADRIAVAEVGRDGVVADIEGLTIYYGENGGGYLIASIQGANRFDVHERGGANRRVAVIDPIAGTPFGDVEETDGIAVESFGLAAPFERGLLVVHDGENGEARQNFKLFAWEDVAGGVLAVEPARDPRRPVWRR